MIINNLYKKYGLKNKINLSELIETKNINITNVYDNKRKMIIVSKVIEKKYWLKNQNINGIGNEIGTIRYSLLTGEIIGIVISEEYRGRELGKQILLSAFEDLKKHHHRESFVISVNELFFDNVFNNSFRKIEKYKYVIKLDDVLE